MRPIHARYPFLEQARAAAEDADVSLVEIIDDPTSPVLRRARERVDEAITAGRVDDPGRDPYVEVLSYPLARILVSLVDEPALTARYAEAEAARAHELFTEELRESTELRSRQESRLTLAELLAEFDLDGSVRTVDGRYRLAAPGFLQLATGLRSGRWRLVNRALDDGEVPVTEAELFALLREAVRQRVADGLPLTVPDEIADRLNDDVDRIDAALANVVVPTDIDTVDPSRFPPCVSALIERVEAGRDLPSHSQFALVSFLAGIGLSESALVDRFANWLDATDLREQYEHLHGTSRASAYPPPGCETMQAYGDCVNMDDLCERIDHPMEYYAERLGQADGEAITPD